MNDESLGLGRFVVILKIGIGFYFRLIDSIMKCTILKRIVVVIYPVWNGGDVGTIER